LAIYIYYWSWYYIIIIINKNKHKESTLFILTVFGLYAKIWYSDSNYNKKYPDKEAVANAYIEFAIEGNEKGLTTIAAPDHSIDEIIDNKIRIYDGYGKGDLQIEYNELPSSGWWRISIKEAMDLPDRKTTFQDEIFAQHFNNSRYLKGRWHVMLGSYNDN